MPYVMVAQEDGQTKLLDGSETMVLHSRRTMHIRELISNVKKLVVNSLLTELLTFLKRQSIIKIYNFLSQLKAAVEKQPVSVCIDASNWYLYKGGVFSNCGQLINHAVLLVAYDDN